MAGAVVSVWSLYGLSEDPFFQTDSRRNPSHQVPLLFGINQPALDPCLADLLE